MRSRPRPSWRSLVTAVSVTALAVAGTAAADAAPARATACNGYVGLTFDDGPSGTTQALLNALRQNGLRAT
ncbi:polysaccharide deacetylase family protein, partial [Nocardia asteroides]